MKNAEDQPQTIHNSEAVHKNAAPMAWLIALDRISSQCGTSHFSEKCHLVYPFKPWLTNSAYNLYSSKKLGISWNV